MSKKRTGRIMSAMISSTLAVSSLSAPMSSLTANAVLADKDYARLL